MKQPIHIRIDGSEKTYPSGTTPAEILNDGFGKKSRDIVAARLDETPVDLDTPLTESGALQFVGTRSPSGLDILRHSTSHIMAQAVQELFENVKVTIGPAIEDGFYYDFDSPRPFTPDDLEKIESRMKEIAKSRLPFRRSTMTRDEAIKLFQEKNETYKVELIKEIDADEVSVYTQGGFTDLCRGPHIPDTGYAKAFKLTRVSGAYWRGDERNAMLQRIYGTAFPDRDELKQHLRLLEEAKKRDHRKLGRELDLFSLLDEVGAGLPIWHPKGALLRYLIEEFERREHLKRGYQMVVGPQILKKALWEKSGHFDNYRDNMYFTQVEDTEYGIKPMNCLAHMTVYKSRIRSYRDLPIRYFELGTVHRHERSGVLHGLARVRQFTQDDAHIVCTPEQLNDEIIGVIEFVRDVMDAFGFEYTLELSTRPEKSIGSDEDWERATKALETALQQIDKPYEVNEGDGAFYGPKIDIKLRDALARSWQCATVQCDFTLPERFDLTYVDADGERKRPVMIHRVILGSIERFIGILIEHYAGAFPVWLSPVQAVIMTITDRQDAYAHELAAHFGEQEMRVETDLRNEKIGYKIREAREMKIPYMIILGDQELEEKTVSVRKRGENSTSSMSVQDFVKLYTKEVEKGL